MSAESRTGLGLLVLAALLVVLLVDTFPVKYRSVALAALSVVFPALLIWSLL